MFGRGRGRGGWGRGGFGRGAQLPFERFPEIEDLGKARYTDSKRQLIIWSMDLQKFWKASPYFYESAKKVEKPDIERYSDRVQGATKKKRPLGDYIFMDADHLPGELAKAGGAGVAKNVRWDMELDEKKFEDEFRKVEQKAKGKHNDMMMMRKAEEEDKEEEDDDEEVREDDEELDDDDRDDYEVGEYVDDDEDDYNDDVDNGNDEDTY